MPLSDEQINAIAGPADYWDRRVFARAIESEATAPLLAQIADLEAQLAEARKDAERYQRLRAKLVDRSSRGLSHWVCSINAMDELDSAIDAAIAQEQPAIQPTQQEQPRHLWDGSPMPNYRVTPEKNTTDEPRPGVGSI